MKFGFTFVLVLVAAILTDVWQEYTLHQFTVLASGANKLFQFTQLSMIVFR